MTSSSYRTAARELRHEGDKIRGSRFIATVRPVGSEAEVSELLDRLRREFPEANHHGYAFRLGTGRDLFRYGDDGEPSGTAGRPILQRIDGHGLTDVAVAVSRIFGGTKLGAGGLIRAYGGAAGAALDRVEVVEVCPVLRLRLRFPYELTGTVRAVLAAAGVEPAETAFGETVSMSVEIPEERAETFLTELGERSAGRVRASPD